MCLSVCFLLVKYQETAIKERCSSKQYVGMYVGRCETEPEAPGGAADEGTDGFSGPPDTTAAGTVSGAGVPSGRLPHIQPHCGPLQ